MSKTANDAPTPFTLEITKACGNCDCFSPHIQNHEIGRCLRHAPQPIVVGMQQDKMGRAIPLIDGAWPMTRTTHVCYEHVHQAKTGESMPVDFATVGKPQ